jgi:hypothetical protein
VTPGQPSTITLFPEVAAAFNAAGQSGLVYDIENSTYVLCGDEMTIVSPVFGTYVLTWDGTGFVNPNYAGGWLAPQSSFEIGCGDSLACNYDPCTIYWGECFYPESPNLDCDGNCLNDADGDGICDEDETYGCTDEAACNYNPDATNNIAGSGALIAVTAGSWPSEISWTLNGETYGAPFSQEFALDPGTYTISTADSYGDGWNGAVMTITDLGSGEVVTYTLDGSSPSSPPVASSTTRPPSPPPPPT